jgi:GTPase involved in cell partitioning and DNA repair
VPKNLGMGLMFVEHIHASIRIMFILDPQNNNEYLVTLNEWWKESR